MKVTYQGVRGGARKNITTGYTEVKTSALFAPDTSICIDEYKGSGANYEKRDEPLVFIEIDGDKVFHGTFAKLKEILINHKSKSL